MTQNNQNSVPVHIAIIMDGNGRWAKKRGLSRKMGHRQGARTFSEIARYCQERGVQYLTVYAFSTENWKRPPEEVAGIMNLLRDYLTDAEKHREENMRTCFLGDLSALDEDLQQRIALAEQESKKNTGMQINIALNYGGRNEIVSAARKLAEKAASGELKPEEIDETLFSSQLYTAGIPDPELIIRPSGEYRLSNFLPWQSCYSELVFMDVLWPDFKPEHLEEAIAQYQKRERRFGGI